MKNLFFSICFFTSNLLLAQIPEVNGWSVPTPESDSRIIYVSSTGDDTKAEVYVYKENIVGRDPSSPMITVKAFKTIAEAKKKLRPGFADWLLFKNGEEWNNELFGSIELRGASRKSPMVITTYGNTNVRPKIYTGNVTAINVIGSNCSNVMIEGLHFEAKHRTNNGEAVAIRIIETPFQNVLIENCYFGKFLSNITIHDPILNRNPSRSNLKVRRSVLVDAYTTGVQNAGGFFIDNVDSILFEDNVIDHNGWSETIAGATATGFRHNTYFQVGNRNLIFRNNIVSRAAATGGSFRCGGIIHNNLFLSNPQNIQFGTFESTINWPIEFRTGEVSYNVILDSRPEGFDQGRGIDIHRIKNAKIHHNIIAHFTPISQYNNAIIVDEIEGCNLSQNIIYNWGNNQSSGIAYANGIAIGQNLLGTNQIDSNDVQMENRLGYCMIKYGTFSNVTFNGNRYNNVLNQNSWFEQGALSNWVNASKEINAKSMDVPYLNPSRDLKAYMKFLTGDGDVNKFYESCRKLSKSSWNEDYTAIKVNQFIREGFNLSPTYVKENDLNSIEFFPNPAVDFIQIKNAKEIKEFRLVDINGIKIRNWNGMQNPIPVQNLKPGTYFLEYQMEEGTKGIVKFIKF
jgi:hypothetical protein